MDKLHKILHDTKNIDDIMFENIKNTRAYHKPIYECHGNLEVEKAARG